MNGKRCHTASRRLCVYRVVEALELEEMVVFRTFALNVMGEKLEDASTTVRRQCLGDRSSSDSY